MKEIFIRVEVPRHHRQSSAAQLGEWYTWSDSFLNSLHRYLDRVSELPKPKLVSVGACAPYDATYTYRLSALSRPLAGFALDAAHALLAARERHSLRFFSGMLTTSISSPVLHRVFALLRCGIAAILGDGRAALHSPIATKRTDHDGFLLHADLFVVDHIWLIFDEVSPGRSGQSLFLSTEVLRSLICGERLMLPTARARILSLLMGESGGDAFDECYDLLHSERHQWARSLAASIDRRKARLKLRRGEGYLLNDRRWLHGRLPVQGNVRSSRFHRLVYGL
jgi:hypothetical protein